MPGSAASQLVRDLSDRDGVKRAAARAQLIEMGPSSVPDVLPLLAHKDRRTRWEAAKALSEMPDLEAGPVPLGEIAQQAVPLLEDKDSGLRWLGAKLLINVGPESVRPVLRRLIAAPGSQYLQRGAHHVFRDLSLAYEPLRNVLSPVNGALDSLEATDLVPEEAQKALREAERLGPLERTESILAGSPKPDQYLFDSHGGWIAFRSGQLLYDIDGDVMGWFPWNDEQAVDIKGNYLGSVFPGDRLLYDELADPPAAPSFPGYPPSPAMVAIPAAKPDAVTPANTRDLKVNKKL